ncbi:MAG: hypothetical protein LBF94_02675 [Puniceicoccales bacterium]|jgi:hypothetical protein|nr:hypothetical protein [Puniceicoccales bacterium]
MDSISVSTPITNQRFDTHIETPNPRPVKQNSTNSTSTPQRIQIGVRESKTREPSLEQRQGNSIGEKTALVLAIGGNVLAIGKGALKATGIGMAGAFVMDCLRYDADKTVADKLTLETKLIEIANDIGSGIWSRASSYPYIATGTVAGCVLLGATIYSIIRKITSSPEPQLKQ